MVAPAVAADGGLTVSKAWMRTIIPERPAAGYFTLTNDGDKAQDLTGASSPACGMVMLHESIKENAVEKMRPVDHVPVAAHGSVAFAPGGYHLMCMQPTSDVKPGKTVSVTLEFKDGTRITSDFPVRNALGK
jgi:periplasmic copper chaperone A